jgi:hypothetical protein
VEHRKADVRQVTSFAVSADDAARFLRELRQLRDGAGLGQAELAARAHFPYDSIKAAEVGPALPDLPVLSAYVRGCGGTAEEWEERWRSLTRSPSLPVPASRTAGRSDAATAGARIGSVSQIGDNPDPSIILAALNRVAEEMASPVADPVPPSFDVQSAGEERAKTEASLSSLTEAFTSADEPMTADKPSGWDPIRVSTAWPVIRDTPTVTDEPAGDNGSAPGIGETMLWKAASAAAAPWETAAWEKDRSGADSSAKSAADAAAPAAGAATVGGSPTRGATAATEAAAKAATDVARVPGAGQVTVSPVSMDGDAGRASSRTRVLVTAAVLLCVLAVLLAVFA